MAGKKHGVGRYVWQNGAEYSGEFHFDMPEGFGVYKKSNANEAGVFEGYFKEGKYLFHCRSKTQCQSTLKLQALDKAREAAAQFDYQGLNACFDLTKYRAVEFYMTNDVFQTEHYRIKAIDNLEKIVTIEKINVLAGGAHNNLTRLSCSWLNDYLSSLTL